MSSPPIEMLPPELLARVFDFLAGDCRAIQHSRLVCKAFRDLSSHHLITRVVIAERLESPQRTQCVMDNPYFSKHVTHLVWDVSQYRHYLANDLEGYKDAWDYSSRDWWPPRTDKPKREARDLLAELLRYEPRVGCSSLPGDDWVDIENDGSDIYDMRNYEHARGIDGFAIYHHRYYVQKKINERQLIWRYLHLAFANFPQLRHIDFTDFRACSLQGESFQGLTERLFGYILPPSLMCLTSEETSRNAKDDSAEQFGRDSLCGLVTELRTMGWLPESFSIGRDNFHLPELNRSWLYEYRPTPQQLEYDCHARMDGRDVPMVCFVEVVTPSDHSAAAPS